MQVEVAADRGAVHHCQFQVAIALAPFFGSFAVSDAMTWTLVESGAPYTLPVLDREL